VHKVLIANRGEIALRIQRSCRELGIQTVAAYAAVDREQLHLKFADEIVCISKNDYLCSENLVSAALTTGCDAVHPGYGFLSENAEFCRLVEDNGLTYIGPTSEQIAEMGNKILARRAFSALGISPVPGSEEEIDNLHDAATLVSQIGYPVVVKAAFGGGGRGIRIVNDEAKLEGAFSAAKAEAAAVFGDGAVYIEKFLYDARHIEVQIFGDGKGAVIHFGTRECSIQRRQQKVIEEAPAPNISQSLLDALCERAVAAVAAIGYRNAGTLEFLYQDGEFYFVEMNTRIQVEHPVTEAITGHDLLRLQIETADSNLSLTQNDIMFNGSAIECRINAEDDCYLPSPGLLTEVIFPGGVGVRVDSHIYAGYRVPHQFDSLVAKLIVWDRDRPRTLLKMQRALEEMTITGIETNKVKLQNILAHEKFREGKVNTRFLDQLTG
jgi:acetyl-CoA carboxylase biotin carboxylase subunit